MNAMVSMLVLLFIGQTVAFDLSKMWLPDDMIMESKFDTYTHVYLSHTHDTYVLKSFCKGWGEAQKRPP